METVRTRNARADAYGFGVDCQGSSPTLSHVIHVYPHCASSSSRATLYRSPLNSTDESDLTNHPLAVRVSHCLCQKGSALPLPKSFILCVSFSAATRPETTTFPHDLGHFPCITSE